MDSTHNFTITFLRQYDNKKLIPQHLKHTGPDSLTLSTKMEYYRS